MFRISVRAECPAIHDAPTSTAWSLWKRRDVGPGTEERGRHMRRDPDRQRHLRRGNGVRDDLDAPPDDTLDVDSGSNVRGFGTDEGRPDQPTGLLDERPQRRGLNRLIPTGWPRTR